MPQQDDRVECDPRRTGEQYERPTSAIDPLHRIEDRSESQYLRGLSFRPAGTARYRGYRDQERAFPTVGHERPASGNRYEPYATAYRRMSPPSSLLSGIFRL